METLVAGFTQREKVLPSHVSYEKNTKKIGFFQPAQHMSEAQEWENDDLFNYMMKFRNRTARIFLKDKNHMQSSNKLRRK